jgi:hypothetical protein
MFWGGNPILILPVVGCGFEKKTTFLGKYPDFFRHFYFLLKIHTLSFPFYYSKMNLADT